MSFDNGIYILQTGTGYGKEFRVAHCMAIDNISCKGYEDAYLVLYFGECKVILDEQIAQTKAFKMLKKYSKMGPVEYGISTIVLRKQFPQMSYKEAYKKCSE